MAPEVIVFLSIGEKRAQPASLGSAQGSVMEKRFLPKRAGPPTFHALGVDGDPVDTPGLVGHISAYLLKALPPKQLKLSGDMILALEAVGLGAVAFFFENCSGHSEARVLGKPL